MSPVANLKRKQPPDAVPKRQPVKPGHPGQPRTPEAAARRREFALLMRSIKSLVQRAP
jgi:hypothetical protein